MPDSRGSGRVASEGDLGPRACADRVLSAAHVLICDPHGYPIERSSGTEVTVRLPNDADEMAVMVGGDGCGFTLVGEQPAKGDLRLEREMLHPGVSEVGGRLEPLQGRGTRASKALPIGGVAS